MRLTVTVKILSGQTISPTLVKLVSHDRTASAGQFLGEVNHD